MTPFEILTGVLIRTFQKKFNASVPAIVEAVDAFRLQKMQVEVNSRLKNLSVDELGEVVKILLHAQGDNNYAAQISKKGELMGDDVFSLNLAKSLAEKTEQVE